MKRGKLGKHLYAAALAAVLLAGCFAMPCALSAQAASAQDAALDRCLAAAKKKYGVIPKSQKKTFQNCSTQGDALISSKTGFKKNGLLAAVLSDFDGDGQNELLLVRDAKGKTMLDLYEAVENKAKRADSIQVADADYCDAGGIFVNAVTTGSVPVIVVEYCMEACVQTNGGDENITGYVYQDGALEKSFALEQEEPGSSDLAYDGVTYQNGKEKSRKVIFGPGSYGETTFGEAAASFLQEEHGIPIDTSFEGFYDIYSENGNTISFGIRDSVVAQGDSVLPILARKQEVPVDQADWNNNQFVKLTFTQTRKVWNTLLD
ncbi:MAG: hypothetical protein ACI4OJ_10975 [Lachnospiraceae bacterium]